MNEIWIVYIIICLFKLFVYFFCFFRMCYFTRRTYRSGPIDLTAGVIYIAFSIYYNVEFVLAEQLTCKGAYLGAQSAIALMGLVFLLRVIDLHYAIRKHSVEQFNAEMRLNFNAGLMRFFGRVHREYLVAIGVMITISSIYMLLTVPFEYPFFNDVSWNSPDCKLESRVLGIMIPTWVLIFSVFGLAYIVSKWKEDPEYRMCLVVSTMIVMPTSLTWWLMFEYATYRASSLCYDFISTIWLFLLVYYGHILPTNHETKAINSPSVSSQRRINPHDATIPHDLEEVFTNNEYFELWKKFVSMEFSIENTLGLIDIMRIERHESGALSYEAYLGMYLRSGSVEYHGCTSPSAGAPGERARSVGEVARYTECRDAGARRHIDGTPAQGEVASNRYIAISARSKDDAAACL